MANLLNGFSPKPYPSRGSHKITGAETRKKDKVHHPRCRNFCWVPLSMKDLEACNGGGLTVCYL